MAGLDKDLASSELITVTQYDQIFAGEMDVITDTGVLDTGNLAKYTVLGMVGGKYVPFDSTASTGAENAVAILAQPADASSADVVVPVFIGGFFNHAALVWDAPTNTLALRKAAFATNKLIQIGQVRLGGMD